MENAGPIIIGKVVGAHGIQGALKVQSYAESVDVFFARKTVTLKRPSGEIVCYDIETVKPHSKGILLHLKGVTDRFSAEAFRGTLVQIDRSELPELDTDSYYWVDLIGMAVISEDGDHLGMIESILQTGSNDVYVVGGGDKEILLPALGSVVLNVDMAKRRIRVRLPEGL
ncbi:MAG: ribosome maturation factor RimM [Desulfobacterales bacterium]